MTYRYHEDCCQHTYTEYVGTLRGVQGEDKVDVYFLDETGGHSSDYHGMCLRYSSNPEDYCSGDPSLLREETEVYDLYQKWCLRKGYTPQDAEHGLLKFRDNVLKNINAIKDAETFAEFSFGKDEDE